MLVVKTMEEHTPKVEECIICLEEMKEDLIILGTCNHKFHSECIKKWFDKQKFSDCPICDRPSFNFKCMLDNGEWEKNNIVDVMGSKTSNKYLNMNNNLTRIVSTQHNDRLVVVKTGCLNINNCTCIIS